MNANEREYSFLKCLFFNNRILRLESREQGALFPTFNIDLWNEVLISCCDLCIEL